MKLSKTYRAIGVVIITMLSTMVWVCAQTLFTGPTGGSINDVANWSNGLPAAGNVGALGVDAQKTTNAAVAVDITDGATLLYTQNTFRLDTLLTIQDGVLQGSGNTFFTETTKIVVQNNGAVDAPGASIQLRQTSNIEVLGGSVEAYGFTLNLYTPGAAFLTLGAGDGSVVTGRAVTFNSGSDGYINFISGSGATVNLGNQNEAYYEGLWNAGQLRVDGANVGVFADKFEFDAVTNELSLVQGSVPINAPVAKDDVVAWAEDRVLRLDFLHLNDTDLDRDLLTVVSIDAPENGTLVQLGPNDYTYTPDPGFAGREELAYTISDPSGLTDTAKVVISVNATIDVDAARDAILGDMTTFPIPQMYGQFNYWGVNTFGLLEHKAVPGNVGAEISTWMAAASLGSGKVLGVASEVVHQLDRFGDDPMAAEFYVNSIEWLTGSTSQSVKIVTSDEGALTWLTAKGYSNVVLVDLLGDLVDVEAAFQGADLFIGSLRESYDFHNASVLEFIRDFASDGGGLFLANRAGGYTVDLNSNRVGLGLRMWEIPENIIIREAGLAFTGRTDHVLLGDPMIRTTRARIDIDTAESVWGNLSTVAPEDVRAVDDQVKHYIAPELKHQVLPLDDTFVLRLKRSFVHLVDLSGITPSFENPITDYIGRSLMFMESNILLSGDPLTMEAHRTIDVIDPSVPRVVGESFTITPPPSEHKTKIDILPYYAPAGELVTLEFPEELLDLGLRVRVSLHNRAWINSPLTVMPIQVNEFEVATSLVQVANPFGGMISVIIPNNVTWPEEEIIRITGAVKTPYFVLGETTDAEWVAGIRDRPTPFGLLHSPEATLLIAADLHLRDLEDPEAVMTEWNYFIGKVVELFNYNPGKGLIIKQDYYPVGGVSTDPQSYAMDSPLVDSLRLQGESFGLTFHEYGHIASPGSIIFNSFNEALPNLPIEWVQRAGRKYANKQNTQVGIINEYLKSKTFDFWDSANHSDVQMKAGVFEIILDNFDPNVLKAAIHALVANPPGGGSQGIIDGWIRELSNQTGRNLYDLFDHWQLTGSESLRTELEALPVWLPIIIVPESLVLFQETPVVFSDPSANDFSFDGVKNLDSLVQPANGVITDNGDGTYTYTPSVGFVGTDSFEYTLSNNLGNSFTSQVKVTVNAPSTGPKLAAFDGFASGEEWTTVNLEHTYDSMVVVAQPVIAFHDPVVVTRIRNASGSSFEVKVVRLDGLSDPVGTLPIRFLVAEEGVYNEMDHGVKMEVAKFTSTLTDSNQNIVGERITLAHNRYDAYFIPNCFGQVMTSNDPDWSAYWCLHDGSGRILMGKHVGGDPDKDRVAEEIGYIVIEAGSYQFGDYEIQVSRLDRDKHLPLNLIKTRQAAPVGHTFDRFPMITSAMIGGLNTHLYKNRGDRSVGSVIVQAPGLGNELIANVAQDSLSSASKVTQSQGSYLLAHYTGDRPVAITDTMNVSNSDQSSLRVLDNDVNGDSGVAMSFTQPTNGQISAAGDGVLIYTPEAGFEGEVTFTYTIGSGVDQSSAIVYLSVADKEVVAITGVSGMQTLIRSGSEVNPGTVILTAAPDHGQVIENPDGTLTYLADAGYTGSDTFSYSYYDGYVDTAVDVSVNVYPETPVPGIEAEYYYNIPGHLVSQLNAAAGYPDNPDARATWSALDSGNVEHGDEYGIRLRGLVVPPTTGQYTFWISANRTGELWLSSDGSPENKNLLAKAKYTGYLDWTQDPGQQSVQVDLVAGQEYYIEVLLKDSRDRVEHVAVSWSGPGFGQEILTGPALRTLHRSAPTVLNPVADIVFDAGDSPKNIDLSGVFVDTDWDDQLTFGVHDNTNPDLVQASISQGVLTLGYTGSAGGVAEITLRATDKLGVLTTSSFTVTVNGTSVAIPAIEAGNAVNLTQTGADIGYSVTDDGGEAPMVTLYYGEVNGGSTAGNWSNSISLGTLTTGTYSAGLTGLTEGTTYYYTVHASNSAGEAWGSTGSFTTEADTSPKLVRTTVSGVSNGSWTSVDLGRSYNSAVIVATPIYPNTSMAPVVTRIRNVSGSSFELKIDRADGLIDPVNIDVSIIAVEEGVYTQAADGVTMEAVKYTSTVTAHNGSWVAEARTYQNSYTSPVVVGQVMSANDTDWSVFWSMGSSRDNPASASSLSVGKHVGEDPDTTRVDETIGYIVIESGSGTINGIAYEAALGADSVRGVGNSSSPYTYNLSGGLSTASAAAASISGMDGVNGAWAVLSGSPSITTTNIGLHALEDQMDDQEQNHATTQVGYIVFE